MWICIELSRNNLASKALRYESCNTRVRTVYLPPNTSYTYLYSPAAERYRPLAGTHRAYPRRDSQVELKWVVGKTETNFLHWKLNPDTVTNPVLTGSGVEQLR